MSSLTKTILATTLGLALTANVFAQEQVHDVDPSDLTKASTSAYVGVNNKGDVKLSGSLAYTLDNGQMAMGTIEGTMNKEGDYNDSRIQYFHVFNIDNAVTPRVAASLDIIDNQQFTTAAVGGIVMFTTPAESLNIFVRGGVLAGSYDEDFANAMGESDTDIVGGMAAAYFSWKTGDDGTYIMFSSEYTYLGGSIEDNTLKTSITFGTPLSQDKSKWGQFKLENTVSTMKSSSEKIDINDTAAWFFFKAYF